ncbi:MAG: hypothetical protein K8T91_05805 [Planctomycetes bacterium]|nr:hypothetical protein [Planctomycetota bacterium]
MPSRIAWGSVGHASITVARAGSPGDIAGLKSADSEPENAPLWEASPGIALFSVVVRILSCCRFTAMVDWFRRSATLV